MIVNLLLFTYVEYSRGSHTVNVNIGRPNPIKPQSALCEITIMKGALGWLLLEYCIAPFDSIGM